MKKCTLRLVLALVLVLLAVPLTAFAADRYSIVFDPNPPQITASEPKGTMPEATYSGEDVLPGCVYQLFGYSFAGWNTSPDGSGASFAAGAAVSGLSAEQGGQIILYAQWTPRKYTVNLLYDSEYSIPG